MVMVGSMAAKSPRVGLVDEQEPGKKMVIDYFCVFCHFLLLSCFFGSLASLTLSKLLVHVGITLLLKGCSHIIRVSDEQLFHIWCCKSHNQEYLLNFKIYNTGLIFARLWYLNLTAWSVYLGQNWKQRVPEFRVPKYLSSCFSSYFSLQ